MAAIAQEEPNMKNRKRLLLIEIAGMMNTHFFNEAVVVDAKK